MDVERDGKGEPISGNPMVDDSPGSLRQGVSLDAAVHQVDGLCCSGKRVEGFTLKELLLRCLECLVRLNRFLEVLAELVREFGRVGGKALCLPVHWGAA